MTTTAITHAEGVEIIHRIRRERGCVCISEAKGHRAGGDEPDCLSIAPGGHTVCDEWKSSHEDFKADRKKWDTRNGRPGILFVYWCPAELIDIDDPDLPVWAGLVWIMPDGSDRIVRNPDINRKRDEKREFQLIHKALIDLERASGRTANEAKSSNAAKLSSEQEARMLGHLDPKEWTRLSTARKAANIGLNENQQITPKRAEDWANACDRIEVDAKPGQPTYIRLKAEGDSQ